MAVFNRKYLQEVYKSKYATYLDDDDDKDDDDEDEEESKEDKKKPESSPDVNKNKDNTKQQNTSESQFLSKEEIRRIMTIITLGLEDFPKLKKCCDYIDLSDRDHINDDGQRESSYDKYYNGNPKDFIELVNGDVFSGYPNFRSGGNADYEKDEKAFVKSVNELLTQRGVKAKLSVGPDKDDEAISFGVKSTK